MSYEFYLKLCEVTDHEPEERELFELREQEIKEFLGNYKEEGEILWT